MANVESGSIEIHAPQNVEEETSLGEPLMILSSEKIKTPIQYPDDGYRKEKAKEWGLRLKIPRSYIFGRQGPEEFTQDKIQTCKKAYRAFKNPEDFLLQEPLVLCFVPGEKRSMLITIDGHHRYEIAPEFKIARMPSEIFTVEQTTHLFNTSGHTSNGKPYTPESLQNMLENQAIDASGAFEHDPHRIQPTYLENIRSIGELAEFAKERKWPTF